MEAAHFQRVRGQALKAGGIHIHAVAEGIRLRRAEIKIAKAVAEGGGRELEPEHGTFGMAAAAGFQGEPQVVLIRPAAEEATGIAVDARDVQIKIREGPVFHHQGAGVFSEGVKGFVEDTEVLILMLLKPGALVMKAELPEELSGFLGKAVKHICSL